MPPWTHDKYSLQLWLILFMVSVDDYGANYANLNSP